MHEELPCTLITWGGIYSLCRQLAGQLRKSSFRIDVIVAIARGGYVPGNPTAKPNQRATWYQCNQPADRRRAYIAPKHRKVIAEDNAPFLEN